MGGQAEWNSPEIAELVDLAASGGLEVERDEGWEKVVLYWCAQPMPASVRAAGRRNPALIYIEGPNTKILVAHEGFIDREANVAIAFPTGK